MASGMPSPGAEAFPIYGQDERSLYSHSQTNGSPGFACNYSQKVAYARDGGAVEQEQNGEPAEEHDKKENKTKNLHKRRGRRKNESLLSSLCQFIADHQIGRLFTLSVW